MVGAPKGIRIPANVLNLLNKLPTSQIAEFSKLTEGYISQEKVAIVRLLKN